MKTVQFRRFEETSLAPRPAAASSRHRASTPRRTSSLRPMALGSAFDKKPLSLREQKGSPILPESTRCPMASPRSRRLALWHILGKATAEKSLICGWDLVVFTLVPSSVYNRGGFARGVSESPVLGLLGQDLALPLVFFLKYWDLHVLGCSLKTRRNAQNIRCNEDVGTRESLGK